MLLFLDKEEVNFMLQRKNIATQLISKQSERLRQLRQQNLINNFYHVKLEDMLVDLYTQQGKCERIKNFPLPRQYATSSYLFVVIFVYLMPFGLMTEFHALGPNMIWFTVPFTVLVGWIFWIMELIGEYATNPFERKKEFAEQASRNGLSCDARPVPAACAQAHDERRSDASSSSKPRSPSASRTSSEICRREDRLDERVVGTFTDRVATRAAPGQQAERAQHDGLSRAGSHRSGRSIPGRNRPPPSPRRRAVRCGASRSN